MVCNLGERNRIGGGGKGGGGGGGGVVMKKHRELNAQFEVYFSRGGEVGRGYG